MRTRLLIAVLLLAPSTTFAQDDARWLPYLGCWQSSVERLADESARICMVPSGAGVKMLTVVGDEMTADQTIVADATNRPFEEPSCTGVSQAEWSRDGNMLFTRADLNCQNRPVQKVSGFHLFTRSTKVPLVEMPQERVWIDIQVVEAAGRDNVRTRRYERVAVPEALADALPAELVARAERATLQAGDAPLAIKDILEASGKVSSVAIEAALFETKTQFALNSRSLIALADAGVNERLIDLMLAISYPSHFAVNRWATVPQSVDDFYGDAEWDDWSFSRPLWASHRFSRFGLFQSPYSYYSGWNLYYYARGDSHAPGGSYTVSLPPPSGTESSGAVVRGQGYTRGRPGNPGSPTSGNGTDGNGSVVSPHSSSSSGGASSAGYSSGSSGSGGDGGGRTAVARE